MSEQKLVVKQYGGQGNGPSYPFCEFVNKTTDDATFTGKDVAVLVKAAWLLGTDQGHPLTRLHGLRGEAMFSPGELSQICALAGVSAQQSQALFHELR